MNNNSLQLNIQKLITRGKSLIAIGSVIRVLSKNEIQSLLVL